VEVLAVLLVLVVLFRGRITGALSAAWLQTWTTVFVSVLTQAIPFLVFGVVLSAVIAVFVPPSFFAHTTKTSAIGAFEIHVFAPDNRNPPSTDRARVTIEPGSEP